jgi:GAF domain-containing protein
MCAVTLIEPDTGENAVVYAAGQHSMFLRGRKIAPGEGVTGWVLANRKPFCNTDPKLDLPSALTEQFDGYKTLAAFPIIKGAVIYGAVTVYSATVTEYSQTHQKLLEEAAALMATALAAQRSQGRVPLTPPLGLADAVLEYELTH